MYIVRTPPHGNIHICTHVYTYTHVIKGILLYLEKHLLNKEWALKEINFNKEISKYYITNLE